MAVDRLGSSSCDSCNFGLGMARAEQAEDAELGRAAAAEMELEEARDAVGDDVGVRAESAEYATEKPVVPSSLDSGAGIVKRRPVEVDSAPGNDGVNCAVADAQPESRELFSTGDVPNDLWNHGRVGQNSLKFIPQSDGELGDERTAAALIQGIDKIIEIDLNPHALGAPQLSGSKHVSDHSRKGLIADHRTRAGAGHDQSLELDITKIKCKSLIFRKSGDFA